MGLEPTISAWKANVLPLHYTRMLKKETGAGEETRTHTPVAPDPKSGASAIPPRPHERRNQKADGNDPLEIRTPDTLIKSQVLCQLS